MTVPLRTLVYPKFAHEIRELVATPKFIAEAVGNHPDPESILTLDTPEKLWQRVVDCAYSYADQLIGRALEERTAALRQQYENPHEVPDPTDADEREVIAELHNAFDVGCVEPAEQPIRRAA